MISGSELAQLLLIRAADRGVGVTHLKLQKLVYYCQGYHLAMFDAPIFPEDLEAWDHGPVHSELYQTYKYHGSAAISFKGDRSIEALLNDNISSVIDNVLDDHGSKGAWKLRQQTHNEQPWKNHETEGGKGDGEAITYKEMSDYFKKELTSGYDESLTTLMDSVESTHNFIEMPVSVKSADDFVSWIRSQ